MNQEFLNFGGYGFFIWPSFIFTFICIYFLLAKSLKEYIKQEKIFLLEINKIHQVEIKDIKQSKEIKEALTVGSNS